MLNDTSVASAGSDIRTCRRIRNGKKIATIRDFHQNICVNSTIWFFHTLTIVVQSGQIAILIFLTYFRFCKTNMPMFFFLLILGLQLIICCAILTESNWTKDGKSNFFRLYLSVSKIMLRPPLIFRLNLFLLLQFIPKIHTVKLQIRLLCLLLKSNLGSALFITEEAPYGIAFQLTIDVIYLP